MPIYSLHVDANSVLIVFLKRHQNTVLIHTFMFRGLSFTTYPLL